MAEWLNDFNLWCSEEPLQLHNHAKQTDSTPPKIYGFNYNPMCCEWPGPRWILWLAWWSWKVWGTQRWLEIPTVAIGPWLVQSSNICWPQENQIQKDGKFWEQISGGRSSWRCPIDVGFIASDDLQPVSRRHTSEPTWDEPRARPPRVGGFRMTFLCETYPDPTE